MAGQRFAFNVQRTTGTVTDTIWQILPASNKPVYLERILIMGKSNTASDTPVEFNLVRQTSAGSGGSSVTERAIDTDDGASLEVTITQGDYSTEPTDSGDIPMKWYVHPQSRLEIVFPFGREFKIAEGERLGLKVITPAQASDFMVNVEAVE